MSTPKPGEIQCPTCHRATPPSAFCTQCGAAVPSSARLRPPGMDRDELDDRMRVRRPGDAPFRRGMGAGEPERDDPYAAGGYEPFRPEPEDALARRPSAPKAAAPRVDHTPADLDAQPVEPPPPQAPEPAPSEPLPPAEPGIPAPPPWRAEPRYQPEEPPYESPPFDGGYPPSAYGDEPRGGGFGPLAVVAVVALGLMAIGLGAILSGVFSGVASGSPSPSSLPSSLPSVAVTASPTLQPTVAPTATPAATPLSTVGPVVFADGFTAQTQPCAAQPESFSGCDSSGSTVSGNSIWVWVGFRKGNDTDLIAATVLDATGGTVGDGSVSLSTICSGSSCNGWLRFRFSGLTPGNYGIRIDRNGQLAAESSFAVSG